MIIYTLIAIISNLIASLPVLGSNLTPANIVNISKRKVELYPFPPPGMDKIITGK